MDEKTQKEDEEKAKAEAEDKAKADEAKKAGAKGEKSDFVKKAEEAAAELRKQNEEKAKLLEKEEKLQDRKEALNALGGGSPAGQKPVEKKETDEEYAERFAKGEANPLEDDVSKQKAA